MLSNYSFIYSLFIYGMTMVCMVMLAAPFFTSFPNSSISVQQKRQKIICITSMSLIFGLVFGMRWDVGTDNLEYLRIYIENDTDDYEPLFKILNDSLYKLKIHYWVYFAIFAFIQVFLFFYSQKRESYLWCFLILSLFGGHFFIDWMNGMRQEMASCIMLLGCNYIITKKPKKYLLFVLLAVGFHTSAFLFIVIYPICVYLHNPIPSRIIQFIGLTACTLVALCVGDILSKVFPAIKLLQDLEMMEKYSSTYSEGVIGKFSEITKIGIMFYFWYLIDSIIILYSVKIKNFFKGNRINLYYFLFYWGALFETFFASNMLLLRPFRYFRIYKLIVVAYLLYYLYKNPSILSSSLLVIIIAFLLVLFVIRAYTAPFNFYFDIPYAP